MSNKRKYERRVWGGFVGGRLHVRGIDTGFGGWSGRLMPAPAIFTSYRAARKEYQDVRPVLMKEQEP